MKESTVKKGVIYYRVSTIDQAENGFSLENQLEACRRFAQTKNIQIVAEFCDDGESAKSADRKKLQEMLKFCADKKKGVNCVIVYKLDRWTRQMADFTTLGLYLQKYSIELQSVTEAIDNNTPQGKLMGNIFATFAQFDNDVRGERVIQGMQKRLETGLWAFKAKFGYLNHTEKTGTVEKKYIIPDPQRAELITYLFEEFSKGIYTEEELRIRVNNKGLRTPKGKEISPQLINRILTSKFYTGVMTVNDKDYMGSHKPLVSEDTFNKCQQLLRKKNKGQSISEARGKDKFPLRHNVLCGYCGRPLTASFSTGKLGLPYGYYRCYNPKCSAKKSIAQSKLEQAFSNYLEEISPKKDFLNAFKQVILDVWQTNYHEINNERENINNLLEKLTLEKIKLIELKKKEVLADEDFMDEMKKVKRKVADTQILLKETQLEEFNIDEAIDYCFGFIVTIPEYWSEANYWQKVKLQSLIFQGKPIYTYTKFETPKLSLIFQLKTAYAADNSLLVSDPGVEPNL
jgi:DNA invertase Pin-like site-specific DNA recombinase